MRSAVTALHVMIDHFAMRRQDPHANAVDLLRLHIVCTAPFGIAAATSRLLKLDAKQSANALALALTLTAPGVGQHHALSTSRWLAVGSAASNGLSAALAAHYGQEQGRAANNRRGKGHL